MLQVEAIRIEKLPFGDLELISELLEFEGRPVLLHYKTSENVDVISYWVDFDDSMTRWLYARISKRDLFNYLYGTASLRTLFLNLQSDFSFFVDVTLDDKISQVFLFSSTCFPEKYLPKEDSFYLDGLNEFYEKYLDKDTFIQKLRENSYIFKVEPVDHAHSTTVGAKDAAFVLDKATDSIEGYIEVSAFRKLRTQQADVSKINRRINKLKRHFSPRISQAMMNSFEVWLAIDTVTYNTLEDKTDNELKRELVEGYKNDVLDVDYSNAEDAKAIAERFTPEERDMIFKPLIRLFDNDNFKISISDYRDSNHINNRTVRLKQDFKEIVFPKPTLEQVEAEINKKQTLYAIVLSIKEGEDITKLKKKELLDNVLFGEEWAESPFEIASPIQSGGISVELRKPLRCTIRITNAGEFQISNSALDLFAIGKDVPVIVDDIKRQFVALVETTKESPDTADPKKSEELERYLVGGL